MYSYIHIPFCENKCSYCKFVSISGENNFKKQEYLKYLLEEINDFSSFKEKLDSIYFGGGTPTSFSVSQISEIINLLERKFGFNKNIEITLEGNLFHINSEKIIQFLDLGINRFSFGIQTLNDKSLKEIGRKNKKITLEKLDLFNKFEDLNISLDFIIGLPYLKKGEVKKDIEFLLNRYNFIKHISVYMLEEYYFYPKIWKNLSIKEDEFLKEYKDCKNYLEDFGLKRYEISNFAKSGFECNHNKSYWNHKNIRGFGLGAHSFLAGERFANSDNFKDYYDKKLKYYEKLNQENIFLEKILFSLRTSYLQEKVWKKLNQENLNYFLEKKLLYKKDEKIFLSDDGVLVLDYIIKEII